METLERYLITYNIKKSKEELKTLTEAKVDKSLRDYLYQRMPELEVH